KVGNGNDLAHVVPVLVHGPKADKVGVIVSVLRPDFRQPVAGDIQLCAAQLLGRRAVIHALDPGQPDIAVKPEGAEGEAALSLRVRKGAVAGQGLRVVAEDLQLDVAADAVNADDLGHQDVRRSAQAAGASAGA